MKKKHSVEQIIRILREVEKCGLKISDACRPHQITEQTRWGACLGDRHFSSQCDFQRGVFFQHKLAGGFARRKRRPDPSFVPPRACEFARVVYRSSTMQGRCGFIFRDESSRPIPTPDDRLIPRQTSPQPRPEAPLRMCRVSPCSQALLSIRDSLHPQP